MMTRRIQTMRLITEDNDNKTYLIYLTKDELDAIYYMAMYYDWNNRNDLDDEDKKLFRDLNNLCATVCAHIYSNNKRG